MNSTNEMLSRFVARSYELREFMQNPFVKGEFVYATDGHIAVRVPLTNGVEFDETFELTSISALFDKSKRDNFIAIPELPPRESCPTCKGTGIAYACPDCDGEGEFEHGMHTYDCKECNGSGQTTHAIGTNKVECDDCGGDGEARYKPVKVGCCLYDRRFLAKIIELPNVKFAPGEPESDIGFNPAYFTFDGGEGLLMPMRGMAEQRAQHAKAAA